MLGYLKCRNDIVFKKTKFNSILQVIFRGAYWLRFWSQLQRKEQDKDTLIALSRKLEVIALQFANEDRIIFIVYLRWGHVVRSCLSALFDFCLNSVIIGCVHLRM
jgi:hypothetical protein